MAQMPIFLPIQELLALFSHASVQHDDVLANF